MFGILMLLRQLPTVTDGAARDPALWQVIPPIIAIFAGGGKTVVQ